MSASDLVTLDEARSALGLGRGDTAQNPAISRLIGSATELIEAHMGYGVQREVVETSDGGQYRLQLQAWPVVSITSVTVDGTAVTTEDWVISLPNYGEVVGNLHRPSGPQEMVITYQAGRFADTASVSDLWKEGCMIQLRHQWQNYQEQTGEVNEFDTAAIARTQAGPARNLFEHFAGAHLPGLA